MLSEIPANPRVRIWMTAYNEARHLQRALDSILAQSFEDFELLVSDNHSTDDTGQILRDCTDPRVTVMKPPQHLAGIEHMGYVWGVLDDLDPAEFTIHVGGHDLWAQDFLRRLVERATEGAKDREVAIVYAETWQCDQDDRIIGKYKDFFQTGQMAGHLLPQYVIAGVSSPQFFGLWSEEIRRKVPIRHMCGGFDHLIVMEAALHGAILYTESTYLTMRAPKMGVGSLEDYGHRHLSAAALGAGPKDFVDQLEWCLHALNLALTCVPAEAQPTYRALSTASMVSTYCALRMQNLYCVPGAIQAFNEDASARALFAACAEITRRALELVGKYA